MKESQFLKNTFGDMHTSPEVESSAKRRGVREGGKAIQKPVEKIETYLDRLDEIFDTEDTELRDFRMDFLKQKLHDQYIIKAEDVPDSYFDAQRRIVREQGHGDVEITDAMRRDAESVIVADQTKSLDAWVDYLSSPDATYPTYLKYFAFRGITKLGKYDKEKQEFAKRNKETVAPFPELNREALAYTLDALEKEHKGIKISEDKISPEFRQYLSQANFGKMYAKALIEIYEKGGMEKLDIHDGQWRKFDQGTDHTPLHESLQGKATGWCTAGESTAQTQLSNGDFYVYYSKSGDNDYSEPRIAIRMNGTDQIGEVRGVAEQQNLESEAEGILDKKLNEFPDAEQYKKKSTDMKQLTEIEKRSKIGQVLTREELVFLYEIDMKIQGFGYQDDPRIKELRSTRNPMEDAPIVFDCSSDEIAMSEVELKKNEKSGRTTKTYIGPLFPGIFTKDIEHIFTTFPEGKIIKYNIELGGQSKDELIETMKSKNIVNTGWAQQLLDSPDFSVSEKKEQGDLIRITVADLGFPSGATTDQIYAKANELGLDLCPAEVGPQLRLQSDDPEWMLIAMKQIEDRGGYPYVFGLSRGDDGLALYGRDAGPDGHWGGDRFVFRPRKL